MLSLKNLPLRRNYAKEVRANIDQIEVALETGYTFDQIAHAMNINRNTFATHVRVARLVRAAQVAVKTAA